MTLDDLPPAARPAASHGKWIGALFGVAFGLAVIYFGFLRALGLAVCATAGWWIGRIADGEVSLLDLVERYSGRDRI